jgi:hypothetical protein
VETRLYRGHFIVAFPSFDTRSARWAPQAEVSWCQGPQRRFRFLKFDERLPSEQEAISFALGMAEAWIDRRTELDPSARGRWREEKALTFAEFRTLLVELLPGVRPLTLQRSYAALERLCRHQRLGWVEARQRVERLRQDLSVARARPRAARLPLTEQAWRRLG